MASIEKRGENTYRITVSAGYDSKGEKIRKRKTITLDPKLTPKQIEKELQKQAALFESEVENGTYLDGGKLTFGEFCEKWLQDYAEKNLELRTIANYKELINKRIIPALGHLKLQKIQPTHLMEFYNNLAEEGMRLDGKYKALQGFKDLVKEKGSNDIGKIAGVQPRTIQSIVRGNSCMATTIDKICTSLNIESNKYFTMLDQNKTLSSHRILQHHKTISTILKTAVHWQLLMLNPAERVKPPKLEKKEANFYEEDEIVRLFQVLKEEPINYQLALNIVIFTGCRLGELVALEWSDVNLDNKLLRIRQSSQYLPGEGIYTKSPKTESGTRIISIPSSLVKLFKQYKAWQNEEKLKAGDQWDEDSVRVFTKWDGTPIFPNTPSQWFRKIIDKHGLPKLKFHELRHTNASLLIAQGVDLRTISGRLGHSKTSITTDVYGHMLKKPDREAADKLEEVFNSKNKKSKKLRKA